MATTTETEDQPVNNNPRKKQGELPHVIKHIVEIDDAAADYVEKRDARMDATEDEVAAKQTLLALMKKHDLQVYRIDDDKIVEIIHEKETVKVSRSPIAQPVKPKNGEAE